MNPAKGKFFPEKVLFPSIGACVGNFGPSSNSGSKFDVSVSDVISGTYGGVFSRILIKSL